MSPDLSPGSRLSDWRERTAAFIAEVVVPHEQDAFARGADDDLRRHLQAAAKEAGIFAPQAPASLGGGGFSLLESAVLLEEAGTSLLGPLALNCHAPDEGNIHMLELIATPAQRERYLMPLVRGDVRSCFAMTEPPPGAGSDPRAMRSTVRRSGGGWVISGEKHLITGAEGAAFSVVMARGGGGDDGSKGATMLLVDTDTPGWEIKGHPRTLDSTMPGGHCRVSLNDIHVGEDAVLGEPGRGFAYAQVRLAPARLTHCMRWLGAARRAHEIALHHAVDREMWGTHLADLGMAQASIADNEIELAAARALLWQTCADLGEGAEATEASSRTKVFVSEAVGRIVDRSVQLCGGMGTTDEYVVGRIYAEIRAFRIYDGASEVHRMSIAKRAVARAREQRGL
ncbi:MAG: acyl-CoA dehydrogenase family protein [Sporichthyaceae bacterium]